MKKIIIPLLLLGLIGLAVILLTKGDSEPAIVDTISTKEAVSDDTNEVIEVSSVYTDGSYSLDDEYLVPGGDKESINMTITVKDDILTDVDLVLKATNDDSVEHQAAFLDSYNKFDIVGEDLSSVSLARIASASLTTEAFNRVLKELSIEARN